MSKLSKNLIQRLVTIKYTLQEASRYLRNTTNDNSFALSVPLVHNAVESLFWALNSLKNAGLKDEDNFLKKYQKIVSQFGNKKVVFDQADVNSLNSIRNSYIHQAVLPNINNTKPIMDRILEDFFKTVQNCFGQDINLISLSDLIHEEKIKNEVQTIEKTFFSLPKITTDDCRNAIYEIGLLYFNHFEKGELTDPLREAISPDFKNTRFRSMDKNINSVSLDHLEIGLEPYKYWRFKNLVPGFVYDVEEQICIPKYPLLYWGKENWTSLNVNFVLNWLINYIIQKEWKYRNQEYEIVFSNRVHIITPKKDIRVDLGYLNMEKPEKTDYKSIKFNLKMDTSYLCCITDHIDGIWQNIDNDPEKIFMFIYGNGKNYDGNVPKVIFEDINIRETYIDEIEQNEKNNLIDNAENAIILEINNSA